MLIDTDVLIWYLRGDEKAFQVIEKTNGFNLSVVTYMELVQGMRNKNELNKLRKGLKMWNAQVLYISEEISARAMFYVEQHFLSYSMQLADALIGATAVVYGIPILTGNDRHYKAITNIKINIFRPRTTCL